MHVELNPGDKVALNSEFTQNQKKAHRRERIWFERSLPLEYRGPKAPINIIKCRNWAMIALTIQIASTLAGFAFYSLRRSRAYLVINGISVLTLANGWYGVIYLSRWNTAIHGILTSSILGVFFLYSILEALIKEDLSEVMPSKLGGTLRYSERGILLFLSIPYFIDFLAGLMTFYLTFLLFQEEDKRDNERKRLHPDEPDIELPADYDENSNLCCICLTRPKNTVIYDCGHRALCAECAEILKERSNKKCPICRRPIKDIITVYS